MAKKILITSFYKDHNPVRQKELDLCVIMNSKNEYIDEMYVFLEGKAEDFEVLKHPKIRVVESIRPTYKMFFELANQVSSEDDIVMISNTDIFFDETLIRLNGANLDNKCLALSRYHYHADGKMILHNEQYSQDVWMFKGKIKPIAYCDFHMGIRGCDNRIAYEIHKAGYDIQNPAKSIRTIHYHISESRNYGARTIPKPYLPVPVGYLK